MGKAVQLLKETQFLLAGEPDLWVNGYPEGDQFCALTAPTKVEECTKRVTYKSHDNALTALQLAVQDQPFDGPEPWYWDNWNSVPGFNDKPGRTLDEIIWLYDDAIDIATERGW